MKQNHWSQDSYIKALKFAARAHQGQPLEGPRVGTDLPYVVHVCMVAMEVIAAFQEEKGLNEDFTVQVALLHDVIEDAKITYRQIADEFGSSVAEGVRALSKKDIKLPKNLKMEDSLHRIRQQPREVWMVKMADRITNLQPPPWNWNKEKIGQYLEEAIMIHNALAEASPFLSARLLEKIKDYRVHTE
jgi:(p)ppGpp synthase/HD superfamily hydrolase